MTPHFAARAFVNGGIVGGHDEIVAAETLAQGERARGRVVELVLIGGRARESAAGFGSRGLAHHASGPATTSATIRVTTALA